jgi:hypothetical protein
MRENVPKSGPKYKVLPGDRQCLKPASTPTGSEVDTYGHEIAEVTLSSQHPVGAASSSQGAMGPFVKGRRLEASVSASWQQVVVRRRSA